MHNPPKLNLIARERYKWSPTDWDREQYGEDYIDAAFVYLERIRELFATYGGPQNIPVILEAVQIANEIAADMMRMFPNQQQPDHTDPKMMFCSFWVHVVSAEIYSFMACAGELMLASDPVSERTWAQLEQLKAYYRFGFEALMSAEKINNYHKSLPHHAERDKTIKFVRAVLAKNQSRNMLSLLAPPILPPGGQSHD